MGDGHVWDAGYKVGARERSVWASAATSRKPCDPTESQASAWALGRGLRRPGCCPCLFLLPVFQKAGGGGRQTAHILKGEIISLLPVLGKMIRSQKCLLVTLLLKDILALLDGKIGMLFTR